MEQDDDTIQNRLSKGLDSSGCGSSASGACGASGGKGKGAAGFGPNNNNNNKKKKQQREAAAFEQEGATRDAVFLGTVHQSKGLEWPIVFVVRFNEVCYKHVHGSIYIFASFMYLKIG
jgi:hypothetical protein